MTIETKQRANERVDALTAENVMDRNCLIIPQHMLVREAARLLHRKQLDDFDRPAGIVSATDVLIAIVDQMPEQRETTTKPK